MQQRSTKTCNSKISIMDRVSALCPVRDFFSKCHSEDPGSDGIEGGFGLLPCDCLTVFPWLQLSEGARVLSKYK